MKIEDLIFQLCGFEFNTEEGNNVMDQEILNRQVKLDLDGGETIVEINEVRFENGISIIEAE